MDKNPVGRKPTNPFTAKPFAKGVGNMPPEYLPSGHAHALVNNIPPPGYIPDPDNPPETMRPRPGRKLKWGIKALQMAEKGLQVKQSSASIARALMKECNISRITAYRILRVARARETDYATRSLAQHKAESLNFYRSVVSSPTATWTEKIAAQARIDKIMGLEKAARVDFGMVTAAGMNAEEVDRSEPKEVDHAGIEKLFTEFVASGGIAGGNAGGGGRDGANGAATHRLREDGVN